MSDYYNNSGTPGTRSALSSSAVRTEFAAISTGFNKLAPLTGNGNRLVKVNAGGTAQEVALMLADTGTGILIGPQTPRSVGGASRTFQIETAAAEASASIMRNSADTLGGVLVLGKSRGTLIGTSNIVQSGDEIGSLIFAGADGTDANTPAAAIQAFADGTPGANDMPGRLVFSTTADGGATPTERLRIDSAGLATFAGAVTVTGVLTAPTAAVDTNTTQVATTAYVIGQGYLKSAAAATTYAPLASPTLTGVPAAPTAGAGTNTTQLATTAFVNTAVTGGGLAGSFTTLATQAGSALLPSIIPASDANTGRWYPAADTIAESTGGVERMRIDTIVKFSAQPTLTSGDAIYKPLQDDLASTASGKGAALVGFSPVVVPAQADTAAFYLSMLTKRVMPTWPQFAGGAKGTWNGTTGDDDTAAFEACITYCQSLVAAGVSVGVTLYIPRSSSGRYKISRMLTIPQHIFVEGENDDVQLNYINATGASEESALYFSGSQAFGGIFRLKVYDYSGTTNPARHIVYVQNQVDGEGWRIERFLPLGGTVACVSVQGCTYLGIRNCQGGQSLGYWIDIRQGQSDHVLNIENCNFDSCRKGMIMNGSLANSTGATVQLTNIRYEHNNSSSVKAITATAANGGNTQVTAAAHGYVSGDVNTFVYVTGTTFLTPGFYRLVSVVDANGFVIEVTYPGTADTAGSCSLAQDIVTINTTETTPGTRPVTRISGLHLSVSGVSSAKLGFGSIVRINTKTFRTSGDISGIHWGTSGATPAYLCHVPAAPAKSIVWSNAKHRLNFFNLNDADSGTFLPYDMYEAPTAFTPVASGATTAGVGTYTTQTGRYSRIGKLVFFEISLTWTAHTGTGGLRISGLPYTIANVTNLNPQFQILLSNYSYTAGSTPIASGNVNGTNIFVLQIPSGGGAAVEIATFDTSGTVLITGTYLMA